jgi:hypothetical protein
MVTSPLTRPGQAPVPRSLLQQCEGTGLQGRMGPFCTAASFSHAEIPITHPTLELESVRVPFVSFGDPHFTFRIAPSGTRPFSR